MFCKLGNKLWWGAVLQFWLFFAVPIFTLRILYPHSRLIEVEVLGMPMKYLHSLSNVSYFVLVGITILSILKERKIQKKQGP